MINFTFLQWLISVLCAMMIGFTKAGIPGSGILVPLLGASIIPARESTGFVLPMLIMADMFAIVYWRRNVEWKQLVRLMPWALLGILSGYLGLNYISNIHLRIFIGTSAWFFFLVNLIKLPFSHRLDLISIQSLQTNLVLLPGIIIGGVIGIFLVRHISQKIFNIAVQLLAVAAALFLIFI